jgi:hypothetical protein
MGQDNFIGEVFEGIVYLVRLANQQGYIIVVAAAIEVTVCVLIEDVSDSNIVEDYIIIRQLDVVVFIFLAISRLRNSGDKTVDFTNILVRMARICGNELCDIISVPVVLAGKIVPSAKFSPL